MTTRARFVFGLFVGLVAYGYLRLSKRITDNRLTAKLLLSATYGKTFQSATGDNRAD